MISGVSRSSIVVRSGSMRRSVRPLTPSNVGNSSSSFSNVSASSCPARAQQRVGEPVRDRFRGSGTRTGGRCRAAAPGSPRAGRGVMFHASTCMTQPFSGKRAVTSSERKKSGRSTSVQPAGDRVVVGERHQRHAARLAQLVLPRRRGVALRAAEEPRVPLVVSDRSRGVQVQIASRSSFPLV